MRAVSIAVVLLAAGLVPGASAASPLTSLRGATVVIDPGHNPGNIDHVDAINRLVDYGAGTKTCDTTGTANLNGYAEARFTLDVSARLRSLLVAAGAKVILTHSATSPPFGPCIQQRAEIGNRAHADVAISIHADGGPPGGHGFAAIAAAAPLTHTGLTAAMVASDLRLAQAIRAEYPAATGIAPSSYLGSNGIFRSDYYGGLDWSRVPKVLLETANMRNRAEGDSLELPAVRQRIARGIELGLARFLAG